LGLIYEALHFQERDSVANWRQPATHGQRVRLPGRAWAGCGRASSALQKQGKPGTNQQYPAHLNDRKRTKEFQMFEREILAAVLRWHTSHVRRLAATAKLYEHSKAQRQTSGHSTSDLGLSANVIEAKRIERAALRALAKVCDGVRGSQHQVTDADVIELPVLRIGLD
jgi:hypothetical protein